MQYDQAGFMRKFNETHREEFNPKLFERDNQDIINAIYNVLKSCEKDRYFTLKLLDFEVIEDYEKIFNKLREHEESRKKKNDKTENQYNFINIKDTDMMLIVVHWFIRHNGSERQEINNKTITVDNPQEVMEVLIAVPRFVRDYYFRLNGNYYTATFQIVDGSTYNNSTASQSKVDTVSLKTTFSPVRIFRSFHTMVDIISGEPMKVLEYNSIIFNITANSMYYILAAYGMYGAQKFFGIEHINVSSNPGDLTNKNYVCFEKNGIYISCPKVLFQDPMVQSLVATFYSGIMKETTANDMYNQRYWLRVLGIAFKNATVDKGLFVLDSIDGVYDMTTENDLHLPLEYKETIFAAIRWVLREFGLLRVKENVDVRTKRIRIADYIAQAYGTRLNMGLYGLSDLGRRVTMKRIKQRIYTQPTFLLNQISGLNNLVEYRDLVNDMDASVALKYTYKGISGLGEDGASIQPIYKYIDPSHVGILDLDASSNSDPGMSGMICPMTSIYEHSFSQYEEPDTWPSNYQELLDQYNKIAKKSEDPIEFTETPEPFPYKTFRDRIVEEELEYNRVYCPLESIDGSVNYSMNAETIIQNTPSSSELQEPVSSLFNIRDDDDDETGALPIDDDDDYYVDY